MSETENVSSDIIKGITRLEVGQEGILAHLTTLNGNVERLWKAVNEDQRDLLKHALECDLRGRFERLESSIHTGEHPGSVAVNKRISALEQHVAAEKKADEVERIGDEHDRCTRNKWEDRAWQVGGIIIAVIVVLVLEHASLFKSLAPGPK